MVKGEMKIDNSESYESNLVNVDCFPGSVNGVHVCILPLVCLGGSFHFLGQNQSHDNDKGDYQNADNSAANDERGLLC